MTRDNKYNTDPSIPGRIAARHDGLSGKAEVRLQSTALFSRSRLVVIEHQGEEYHLRLTSKGKLILTK